MAIILIVQWQRDAQLCSELADLRARLTESNSTIIAPVDAAEVASDELARLRNEHAELLRLRGEVGMLRRNQADATRIEVENARLRATLTNQTQTGGLQGETNFDWHTYERQIEEAMARSARDWGLACLRFAEKHGGTMPETLDQAAQYYPDKLASAFSAFANNTFEIVFKGSLKDIADPHRAIIIRQTQPHFNLHIARWRRTYVCADGKSSTKFAQRTEEFATWEREHSALPP